MGWQRQSQRFVAASEDAVYMDDGSVYRVEYEECMYISQEAPIDKARVDMSVDVKITKSNDAEMLVSGWASVSVNADGSIPMDWQDDVIPASELEKGAINFMLSCRDNGEMHKGESKGTVVESIVFTKEKQESIGIPEGTVPEGWFITVKVHDKDTYSKVKDGTYRMFSIQGTGKRTKL